MPGKRSILAAILAFSLSAGASGPDFQSRVPRLITPERDKTLHNLADLQTIVAKDPDWFPSDTARLQADKTRLDDYEKQLIAYHDCTDPGFCYATDIETQVAKARSYLESRIANADPGEHLAIVLDIDETSLSNYELNKADNFNYIADHWSAWYREHKASAIKPTLELAKYAVEHHIDLFFITGRGAKDLAVTEEDLIHAGYHDRDHKPLWKYLYTRPDSLGSTDDYKARMRADIETGTWKEHIVLNIGDQLSDMAGSPQAELSVKLPNPYYFIP
ncbi:MAG TPA: HAD family acid phosphatase [Acidobacteriaceae bacterium]